MKKTLFLKLQKNNKCCNCNFYISGRCCVISNTLICADRHLFTECNIKETEGSELILLLNNENENNHFLTIVEINTNNEKHCNSSCSYYSNLLDKNKYCSLFHKRMITKHHFILFKKILLVPECKNLIDENKKYFEENK